ncbi:Gypsy retrotransposon integrase-like protein 1 [Vitis vinifera]|uniref:Gypsy retrotransposon integrase-like protein 1 n=1 Tax=Vitis vinifera TaxID=29760 RepID=A0A438CWG4_VITVI|nr:Gypsy retrotransposon integrase-like protein 1 [Vitis vinifera]
MCDMMKLAIQDDVNLAYEAAFTHLVKPQIYSLTSNPPVFGHFFHLGSHFCKCEALCVLVSLTELEFRSRETPWDVEVVLCICSGLGISLITSRFDFLDQSWGQIDQNIKLVRPEIRSERDGLPVCCGHGFDSGNYNRGCHASCNRAYPNLGGSHARMDRLEQRLRQLRTSDRAVTWEDFYEAPVASLPAKFRMPEIERYTGIGCSRIHLRLIALLISPHGDHIPTSVRLAFSDRHPATNNIDELKTRDVKLRPYHAYLELLVGRCDDLRYTHLPRVQNQFADALSTLASMIDIPTDTFLRLGAYPETATTKDKRALRQLAARFVIRGETLYKRSADGMLLLCLDRAPANQMMREVHVEVCGPHMGGHMLAHKIMRTSYFWLTMETYCCQFVQRCSECQIHGDFIHVPPSKLHALTSPCPFSVWGIDIIGKISPKSSSGHEFILVAIDYFTKWVEAASYEYIAKQILTLCYRDTVFNIIDRLHTEKLPFALWAYRTSFHFSSSATLYFLVYGMEAVLPVEIEMGSLRVALEPQILEADWA